MDKTGNIGSVGTYDVGVSNGAASAEADFGLLGGLIVGKVALSVPEGKAIDALFAFAESKIPSPAVDSVLESVKGWLKAALGLNTVAPAAAAPVAAPVAPAAPAAAPQA